MTNLIEEHKLLRTIRLEDIDHKELIDGKYIDIDKSFYDPMFDDEDGEDPFFYKINREYNFYLEPLLTFDRTYPTFVDGLFNFYVEPTEYNVDWNSDYCDQMYIEESTIEIPNFHYPGTETGQTLVISIEKEYIEPNSIPPYMKFHFYVSNWTKYNFDDQTTEFGYEGEEGFRQGFAMPFNSTKEEEGQLDITFDLQLIKWVEYRFHVVQTFGNSNPVTGKDGRFNIVEN